MEYKTVTLTPGSIVIWKEHSKLKQWWYKLRKKELDYNRGNIFSKKYTHIVTGDLEYRIFAPKKQYSENESLWCSIHNINMPYIGYLSYERLACIVNSVREGTFSYPFTLASLENSKYYKEVYATKKEE